MTIIKNIESVQELNEVAYIPFTVERDDLLKFDTKISYVYNNGLFNLLRQSLKSNISLDELIVFNEENLSTPDVINTLNFNSDNYLFPFSKKIFYSCFLSNVIPTLADSIYEMLKATQRIIPIGAGLHKAFVISPKPFEFMPTFEDVSVDSRALSANLISSVTSLTSYLDNAEFFEEQIAQRDRIIEQLLLEIEQIKQQVYSAYQTTWR